jgi:hypothetical protein
MISIASDAAMYGFGTTFPISLSGLREFGKTSDKYPNVPPTALLAEHWSLLDQRQTRQVGRKGIYGKSFKPVKHQPQAPNLIFPELIPSLSTSLTLSTLIPLMIGVEIVVRIISSIEVALGKKR